jgi:BirA family biotin operon repressor/biotin-[acetyl-CoA-carboxylase] ligase
MPQTDTTPATWAAAAVPRRRTGHAVEFHPEIGSTNDRARELLETNGTGVAVVTDLQTAGRGRRGRTWMSPPGVNLMCSVGVRPRLAARDAGWLGAAAALAVREACAPWATLSVRWPNDLVAATGLKVAGLLLETAVVGDAVGHAVIGVGINANWARAAMPAEIRDTATSLTELSGRPVDRVELLTRLLAAMDGELVALEAGSSPVERLRAVSWLDGRSLAVDTGAGTVLGRGAGIADDGSLLLDTVDGRVALAHGEVVRVVPA